MNWSAIMMDNLGSIGLFVRVAERLSFSAVARESGLSPSTVGKSIARLEARLKVRLFHRSTRTLALTADGKLFLERCRRILSEVEAAELEMSQASEMPRGTLRISLPRYSGLFQPVISDFMRRYPAVELDLDFSDRLVDVIGEGFDAAVRASTLTDSGLMRRRMGTFRRVLAASPHYLQEHGHPQKAMDLQQHACLHYRYPNTGRLEQWPLSTQPELPRSLICNSVEMRVHLCLQGQGIACLPDFTVAEHLRDGRLQTILDHCTPNQIPIWLVWPTSRNLSPKLRAFIDCMSACVLQ